MKGIVFTELLEMVETKFGFDALDNVIAAAKLPGNGVYVASGTYPHTELVSIVVALSQETGLSVPDLLNAYGRHLFGLLIKSYPSFTDGKKNPLEFIASVDQIIHVEVRKLYPDAELPKFTMVEQSENKISIDYCSIRKMEEFGIGLMLGCSDHYKMPLDIQHKVLEGVEPYTVRFEIGLA